MSLSPLRARSPRRGQALAEYVLIIAVLSVALVAAAWVLVPAFTEGTDGLSEDASELLNGRSRGSNNKR
jgi:hypothetical protein